MKMRKMAAAVLAAVIAAVSVSAVSFAETDEIREDSKYEITLEKEIVDGEEKAAVTFSGLPKEALTFNYAHTDEVILGQDKGKNVIQVKRFDFNGIRVFIGDNDSQLRFFYYKTYKDELDKYDFEWEASVYSDNKETYPMTFKEDGDTITLTAYLDVNNATLKDLSVEENVVVTAYVDLLAYAAAYYDNNNDGHISDDEEYTWISVGDAGEYVPIYSNEKIALHTSDKWNETAKERVKITNSLNASETSKPETSEPTSSTGVPGDTDKTSDTEDKQETLTATLKNVDSKDGLSGAALEKQIFGDSGWTWGQVEKIEFSSDKLFSVRYTAADGSTKTLGEKTAARAADDGIWNTAWTLDTSLMSKDKPSVKLLAKDGTADITAKVYIKKDAQKPSNGDQKSTGIALAIAPVVLAAGAVIAISKKRK